jgi:hypothetical protein
MRWLLSGLTGGFDERSTVEMCRALIHPRTLNMMIFAS